MKYGRFLAMIATSTVVMFALMYLNTYLLSHVFWSETRAYMALMMGGAMAVIMLAFMLSMYSSRRINAAIFVGAFVVFGISLWLVRSQVTIGDRAFMRAMIPHHSIAIMTSTRAGISDPRVRKLADEIIYAQDKEIAEMRYLIADIGRSGDGRETQAPPASLMSLDEALASAEIAVIDPEFLSREEIAHIFPEGPACTFTYTRESRPVLAVGEQGGSLAALVKISGDLVSLSAEDPSSIVTGPSLAAPGISMRLTGPGETRLLARDSAESTEADLVMDLEKGLRVGYSGYYGCGA